MRAQTNKAPVRGQSNDGRYIYRSSTDMEQIAQSSALSEPKFTALHSCCK